MSTTISIEQLKKLPYLQRIPDDGRIVSLQSYYDHATTEWHLWIPVQPGELGRIAGGEVVVGSYYARQPAEPSRDLGVTLGTLLTMRLSFAAVLREFNKLENDIHRCASIMEKYHIFSKLRGNDGTRAGLLVTSELEYALMLLRSLYDCLQGVVSAVTSKLVYLDGTNRRVTRNLPASFADVALHGRGFRALEEMESRWGIPPALGSWYREEAPFFRELRDLRDGISHHGRNPPTVLSVDWGFAISPFDAPWNELGEWPRDQLWNGRLGSLRSIFAGFISHALDACTRFANVLESVVHLPEPLGDGIRVYVRSPLVHRLVNIDSMRAQPWEDLDMPSESAG